MALNKDALKAVVAILKRRFNNLTAEELIDLAAEILEAAEEAQR